MPKLPRLPGRELIAALKRADFEVIRTKGSHYFMRHPDGRCTVIPAHSGEIIGPGLLNKILKDIEFAEGDLLKYFK
jgi:predicted RNA binding protein YcfA (HicA-like mRNA interferase family)